MYKIQPFANKHKSFYLLYCSRYGEVAEWFKVRLASGKSQGDVTNELCSFCLTRGVAERDRAWTWRAGYSYSYRVRYTI